MSSRGESVSRLIKASTPTVLGLFGALLLALPVRFAEGLAPTPILPLIIVFFWSIYAPSYMPSVSVFFIGLLQDFLTAGPLGLWPLIYLATQYVVMSQRSYFSGREQGVVLAGFSFAVFCAGAMLWTMMSLIRGAALPLGALAAQLAMTIAVYPLFAIAFVQLHRRVIVEA